MAGESGGIRHDDPGTKLTVVGHVCLSHQKIVVTDARDTAAAGRATMDRDEFADMIPGTDLTACRFACIFQVLGT